MKYVVLHQGRVIWGPREWNPYSIETAVSMQGVQLNIPLNPKTGWLLENSVACFAVNALPEPQHDGIFTILAGPNYTNHSMEAGTVDVSFDAVEDRIPYIAGRLKNIVKTKRDQEENSGLKIIVGEQTVVFPTDRTTRERFYVQTLHNDDCVWRIDGNLFITLSPTQQQQLAGCLNRHVQDSFKWEQQMSARIDQCETVESLKAVYEEIQSYQVELPTTSEGIVIQ